jgi:hypothetical protein
VTFDSTFPCSSETWDQGGQRPRRSRFGNDYAPVHPFFKSPSGGESVSVVVVVSTKRQVVCRVRCLLHLYTLISALDLMDTVQTVLTLLVADLVVAMLMVSTVVDEARTHDVSASSL